MSGYSWLDGTLVSGDITCTCVSINLHRMLFNVMKKMATYSLEKRRSGAPADHIQTPSLCSPLFSELSSCLPAGCFHLTFRPASPPELLRLWPSTWLTVRVGCWMCWPTWLMWQWLCRSAAHIRDFTVLLLLLFPLLQCMLLGAGCFLCELCCIGVEM